jgi:DNA (cytosine-5)-methyltransferase 1
MGSSEFQMLLNEADHGMIEDYQLSYGLLLAADYGVAQRRPRTIVIGSRVGPIPLPKRTHSKVPIGDELPWETVRSRIEKLPERPLTTELPDARTTFFDQTVPGQFKWLDLHFGRRRVIVPSCDTTACHPAEDALTFPMSCFLTAGVINPPVQRT